MMERMRDRKRLAILGWLCQMKVIYVTMDDVVQLLWWFSGGRRESRVQCPRPESWISNCLRGGWDPSEKLGRKRLPRRVLSITQWPELLVISVFYGALLQWLGSTYAPATAELRWSNIPAWFIHLVHWEVTPHVLGERCELNCNKVESLGKVGPGWGLRLSIFLLSSLPGNNTKVGFQGDK